MMSEQIKYMVSRFLGWKLPHDFHPDCGIHFDADAAKKMNPVNHRYEPVGTNLLSADQATVMVRHMIEGMPSLGDEVIGGRIKELWVECGGMLDKKKGRFWIEPEHAPEVIRKMIATIQSIANRPE